MVGEEEEWGGSEGGRRRGNERGRVGRKRKRKRKSVDEEEEEERLTYRAGSDESIFSNDLLRDQTFPCNPLNVRWMPLHLIFLQAGLFHIGEILSVL